MTVLGHSLQSIFKSNTAIQRFVGAFRESYLNLSGYRKLGLLADDLIIEENPVVQKVGRISEKKNRRNNWTTYILFLILSGISFRPSLD
jgi:hypothetical protein